MNTNLICGSLLGVSAILLPIKTLKADNLVLNPSFEIEAPLNSIRITHQYDYADKGFQLDFDTDDWADCWVINGAMDAATISFGKKGDDERFLQINSHGKSHIYPADTLPAGQAYRASFKARGEDNGSQPKVTVYLYYNTNEGWLSNQKLQEFPLSDQWESYTFEVPASAPEGAASLRIAYEFSGLCQFDDVEVDHAP